MSGKFKMIVANLPLEQHDRLRRVLFVLRMTTSEAVRQSLELFLAHMQPEAAEKEPDIFDFE